MVDCSIVIFLSVVVHPFTLAWQVIQSGFAFWIMCSLVELKAIFWGIRCARTLIRTTQISEN